MVPQRGSQRVSGLLGARPQSTQNAYQTLNAPGGLSRPSVMGFRVRARDHDADRPAFGGRLLRL